MGLRKKPPDHNIYYDFPLNIFPVIFFKPITHKLADFLFVKDTPVYKTKSIPTPRRAPPITVAPHGGLGTSQISDRVMYR